MSTRRAAPAETLWRELIDASVQLAEEIGLDPEDPEAGAFGPGSLDALDAWRREHGALDEPATVRLGLYLARVLIETHGGGLARIESPGHPLDGEWAITGFARGLAPDYHVPFLVSAARLAADPDFDARTWYRQLLREGG